MTTVDDAAAAVRDGELVIYPTETVYGLGADALDAAAVERVFEAKGRERDKPVSMAVPDIESAREYTDLSERELAFMREFLPGPVTVVVKRRDAVPDVLVAGRDRVGVRIPDHDLALELLAETGPLTATSANISGNPSARTVGDLDAIRERAAVVLDAGETDGGTGSTVVNVASRTIHRRGARADAVESWLDDRD
ncbi:MULTISPECIES: L-threonylcarbamoyladenylate synthase [unclassified Haloarcula]|uniref:L-threonylcarbamoyladenylate synthase n=1 Tax=Haloarcula TaxID=2237 RepID=UPI000EF1812B|nr:MULTISPECIES: L-threonylcarbamoyladenylate synthase [unclassified Haloarcula]RLM40046.1 threonylcarbamoyl-AMP synthase [Haloarcula sp. Atlit-120R]RLM48063.1 threonylcarbamoyl-AMP synthase [Haloarcula sp. Atlit-47R]